MSESQAQSGASQISTLIFSCSGGSDNGLTADRAARQLTCRGKGRLFCMTGVAAQNPFHLQTVRDAERILLIDGCPFECGYNALRKAGISGFRHLRVSDIGVDPEDIPSPDELVELVADLGERLLDRD